MVSISETWRLTLKVLQINIVPLIGFALFFRLLGVMVFAPAFAWVFTTLVKTSGDMAITNSDIASFVFSPAGIVFFALTIIVALAGFFAEQGGFMLIIASAQGGARTGLPSVFKAVLGALPRLFSVAAIQTVIVFVCLVPFLAIAAGVYLALLGEHDINWYLKTRPPEFIAAALIGAVLAIIAAAIIGFIIIRWAVAIPACFFEERTGRDALNRSVSLVRGHMRRTGIPVIGWIVLMSLVAILGAMFANWVAQVLVSAFTGINVLIILMALIVGSAIVASFIFSFVSWGGYSVISYKLFEELSGAATFEQAQELTKEKPRIGLGGLAAILAAIAAASIFISDRVTDELSFVRDVKVTAHRGSSMEAPENTLSAIRKAIEDGADYAEIDVQETADGEIVLLHDSDLMRVSGVPKRIWNLSLAELSEYEAGAWFSPNFKGEPIPTLKQAIDLSRGKIKLNIELKFNGHDVELAKRVADIVLEEKFADESFIASLEAKGIADVRAHAPQLKTGQIVTVAVGRPETLTVEVLSMNAKLVTLEQVRRNRRAEKETHVWTINDANAMLAMIDTGVNNIITDNPAEAIRVIKERAELSDGELMLLALSRRIRE
ncbi:MAG: glycerophosphodiester phosphodiesterase family protein [Hyphomicrobiales bacterium]